MENELEKPKQEKSKRGGACPNPGGARKGAGRPAFVPNDGERKQVESMSGYGVPQHQIAATVRDGIGIDTLREHFAHELVAGKAKASAQVGQTLFQKAIQGDTSAMIWWSKAQMRWHEVQRYEHTSPDGSMTPVIQRALTREELAEELKSRGLPTTVIGDD
jgi:hypothetical protein